MTTKALESMTFEQLCEEAWSAYFALRNELDSSVVETEVEHDLPTTRRTLDMVSAAAGRLLSVAELVLPRCHWGIQPPS